MKISLSKKPILIAGAATALVMGGVCAPPPVNAAAYRSGDRVVLDPGTVVPVTLNNELSSDNSQPGDTFTADVDTSREAYDSILRGAVIEGVVRDAVAQSGNNPGTLSVRFTRLRMPDGTSYVINGSPTSLDSSNLTVGSDGILTAKKGASKDKSLTYAGVGAGAGALISLLSGGKLRIEDILIGGGLGYAAGQILKQQQTQVHDVDLKPGTPMGVLLGNTVLYHRRGVGTSQNTYRSMAPLKYYTYNGQRWSYNPATGERRMIGSVTTVTTTTTRTFHRANRRYYSYMGHPYYLDLDTGERVRLD